MIYPKQRPKLNRMKTINLFEFGKWKTVAKNEAKLEAFNTFLNTLWQNRKATTLSYDEQDWEFDDEAKEQQFLSLNFKKQIRAKNYVGVIRFGETVVNILPKVFKQQGEPNETDLQQIHAHLLWWLSYNSKIQFPKSWSNFNDIKSDFFEILIYSFANYTKTTLTKILYQTYQEVENELPYMKGRLNMSQYIQRNLSQGRWHQLSCVYSSFELDNRFNRIIKYVAKLLLFATQSQQNKRLLSDIVFMLNDVQDKRMIAADCEKVHINPLYEELLPILDYCRLFLTNSTVLRYKNELEVFAFLLPMEVIFEDFVAGFLKRHFNDHLKTIKTQKSDKYLATNNLDEKIFQIRHDIFIERFKKTPIIIDTKYKRLKRKDKKNGVSQSDMYQMVSYAIRRGCTDVKLIYPTDLGSSNNEKIIYKVKDELAENQIIEIEIYEIPIIQNNFELQSNLNLEQQFEILKNELEKSFKAILL